MQSRSRYQNALTAPCAHMLYSFNPLLQPDETLLYLQLEMGLNQNSRNEEHFPTLDSESRSKSMS